MAEVKRANKVQLHTRETSRRHRKGQNGSMNMSLNLALPSETGTSPETHVSGQSWPNKLVREKSLIGTNSRMRDEKT